MTQIEINSSLAVWPSPDMVIVKSSDACNVDGETVPFLVHLTLWPEEAIKFANALLHAAANMPAADFSDVPAELL